MSSRPRTTHRSAPPSPARKAAHAVLMQIDAPKAPGLDALLEEENRRVKLSAVDFGLAREIAFGVARNRLWLEELVNRFLREPLKPEAAAVKMALLVGAYQVAFLDRIPIHAAVDETVRLAAAQPRGRNFRGLTNAVMRRISELSPAQRRPDPKTRWPLRCSVPQESIDLVATVLPSQELEPFFAASNETAPLCLRLRGVNDELKRQVRGEIDEASDGDATIRKSQWLDDCMIVAGRALHPERLLSFRTGRVTVEDEGAQLACLLGCSDAGPRVLDLCAAPGGKTAHLCDHLGAESSVTACDVSDAKLSRLRETLTRLSLDERVELAKSDQILAKARTGSFDLVLVDAPCLGLGTLRRHPEIRYRRSSESLEQIVKIQRELLTRASRLVSAGGLLVYTLCSVTAQEAEETVEAFLGANRSFQLADAPSNLPFDVAPFRTESGLFRTWTHRHGCDSFTIARFRRNS
ncbi:hypothetical protein KQI84_05370 [bacterium]|nr:hypothetical protein [bacterium]